ncbi:helix-turn-helix domain-containing protein [bacterium]|nr:helix-turn-helix domain-containing protein [bacterium]
MNINKSLYELRRERGISQAELARHLGISLQAYNQMEKGARDTLTVPRLLEVCEYLGVWPELVFERGRRYE